MARDYEDIDDIRNLSPEELRQRVEQELRGHAGLHVDELTVHVERGVVRLIGRVGTASEARIAEHVLTDQLGLGNVRNELVVSNLRRHESPEDMEEHLADEDAVSGLLLGDRAVPLNPEAEHLTEDLEGDIYGTTDVGKAIAEGSPYIPPESATPEGWDDRDEREGFAR